MGLINRLAALTRQEPVKVESMFIKEYEIPEDNKISANFSSIVTRGKKRYYFIIATVCLADIVSIKTEQKLTKHKTPDFSITKEGDTTSECL